MMITSQPFFKLDQVEHFSGNIPPRNNSFNFCLVVMVQLYGAVLHISGILKLIRADSRYFEFDRVEHFPGHIPL